MKIIHNLSNQQKDIIVNELIAVETIQDVQSISIILLQFLRKREVKIEDAELFNQLCDMIEKKL